MKQQLLPFEIPFENKLIPAAVSLYEKGYDLLFRVQFREPSIRALVPGGELEFSFAQGLGSSTVLSERAERLCAATIEALSGIIDRLESTF